MGAHGGPCCGFSRPQCRTHHSPPPLPSTTHDTPTPLHHSPLPPHDTPTPLHPSRHTHSLPVTLPTRTATPPHISFSNRLPHQPHPHRLPHQPHPRAPLHGLVRGQVGRARAKQGVLLWRIFPHPGQVPAAGTRARNRCHVGQSGCQTTNQSNCCFVKRFHN